MGLKLKRGKLKEEEKQIWLLVFGLKWDHAGIHLPSFSNENVHR